MLSAMAFIYTVQGYLLQFSVACFYVKTVVFNASRMRRVLHHHMHCSHRRFERYEPQGACNDSGMIMCDACLGCTT